MEVNMKCENWHSDPLVALMSKFLHSGEYPVVDVYKRIGAGQEREITFQGKVTVAAAAIADK